MTKVKNAEDREAIIPFKDKHRRQTMVVTTGATSRLWDFDFETFLDFFRLRDQKTSGAMAPVAPPSSAPLIMKF